jgi:hypothetical protein
MISALSTTSKDLKNLKNEKRASRGSFFSSRAVPFYKLDTFKIPVSPDEFMKTNQMKTSPLVTKHFKKQLFFMCLTLLTVNPTSAQPTKELLDSLIERVLGTKARLLISETNSLIKAKKSLAGKTWDLKDAAGRPAKVTASTIQVCFESIGTPNKVCSDYDGRETIRTGFELGNENAKLLVNNGRIVVESEKNECTTGRKVYWATSVSLTNSKDATNSGVISQTESTGGLGGCS